MIVFLTYRWCFWESIWGLTGLFLSKFALFSNVVSEIATAHQINDEVQVVTILEGIVHVHQESVSQANKDVRICQLLHETHLSGSQMEQRHRIGALTGDWVGRGTSSHSWLSWHCVWRWFSPWTSPSWQRVSSPCAAQLSTPCRNRLFQSHTRKWTGSYLFLHKYVQTLVSQWSKLKMSPFKWSGHLSLCSLRESAIKVNCAK